jgi:hypothetical protein
MQGAQKTTRQLGTLTYSAGTKQSIEIDRTGVVLETILKLKYTVTNGGTAPSGLKSETLARLIKQLEMTLGGADTFINISGWQLARLRAYELKGEPILGMDATVVTTTSTATTYEIVFRIPHFLPRARRPDDTALDLRNLGQCTLSVLWGDIGDLYGTVNGAAISNVTCEVGAAYAVGVNPEASFLLRSLTMQNEEVTSTTSEFQVVIDKGSAQTAYRSLLISAQRDDADADDIVNALKLQSGSFTWQTNKSKVYRSELVEHAEIPPSRLKDGVFWVDPLIFQQLNTAIGTSGLTANLVLEADVTATSGVEKLHILRETIRPAFV